MTTIVRRVKKDYIEKGIVVDVIGESDPFSMLGKSTGYRILIKDAMYLFDMGAPVFQFLGPKGLNEVKGVFCTHSHEDHRRWFTDYVLFKFYQHSVRERVNLVTSENLHEEFLKNSRGALERTLSFDSKRVIEVPYPSQVNQIVIGPKSKFLIREIEAHGAKGGRVWRVVDTDGNIVPPEKAKVVQHPDFTRPRLLFCDGKTGEWVEPDVFYPYRNTEFYESEQNDFVDESVGLRVHAIKSTAWHGPFTISMKFTVDNNELYFTSDTVYDEKLWNELAHTKHKQKISGMTEKEFRNAHVIVGDINDYVERVWSEERLQEALSAYNNCVVIHEVARPGSVVHTSYPNIAKTQHKKLVFTHMPDELVSTRPLLKTNMRLHILDNEMYEDVDNQHFPLNADIYVKEYDRNFVGWENKNGKMAVVEGADGMLSLSPTARSHDKGFIMRVDLYEDVEGRYFPVLENQNEAYVPRADGKIEKNTFDDKGSHGEIVKSLRKELIEKYSRK